MRSAINTLTCYTLFAKRGARELEHAIFSNLLSPHGVCVCAYVRTKLDFLVCPG